MNSTYHVSCQRYKAGCETNSNAKCAGFTVCDSGECPAHYIGLFCFYDGVGVNQYTVCECSTATGYVSQCPTAACGYTYTAPVGGPSTCAAASYCPAYTQCPDGNCPLPGPDAACDCAATATCIGKCCPLTGKCKAASCDGNKINNPSGHERECVVNKDKTNSGGQCPWGNYAYGVKCNYVAGCGTGLKNNCWGYTACAVGTCPTSAINNFCIESGNSDNFKVCGCAGTNVKGTVANCTAEAPPQSAQAVDTCTNSNCASADPYPTCVAACAGGTCVGKCCSATGACQAASCDGNKINDPSGHEHECVVKKDATNSGGQCPWSGQAYGVKCAYLANCSEGQGRNCWGYTACAVGTCPPSAVNVFCIESGSSDNFKICGCSGEGTSLPDGASVANCTRNNTVVIDAPTPCAAGFYCPTPCSSAMCPCGSYCPAGSTAPIPCPSGHYCLEGSADKTPNPFVCPAGSFCPSPVTNPKYYCNVSVCPCGTYCPADSTAPKNCTKAGFYCTQNASEPTQCQAGTYCPAGSCQGTPCPCGSRCPPGTPNPQLCAPPYYCPDTGMSNQTVCPMGYKCDVVGMCNATACPLGTFVSCPGKVRCDPCPAGRYCPNVTISLLCPANFYCPVNTYIPTPCPSGKRSNVGSKSSSQCKSSRRMLLSNYDLDIGGSPESAGSAVTPVTTPGWPAVYSALTLVVLFASGVAARVTVAMVRGRKAAADPTAPQ